MVLWVGIESNKLVIFFGVIFGRLNNLMFCLRVIIVEGLVGELRFSVVIKFLVVIFYLFEIFFLFFFRLFILFLVFLLLFDRYLIGF